MDLSVRFFDDASAFLACAGEFLRAQPVLHNLMLTILDQRVARPEPGRYWAALRDGAVVGAALQTPFTFPAVVVPVEPSLMMQREVMAALVDAVAGTGIELPGVNGEAGASAVFAGHWTERRGSAASPKQGLRLYELKRLNEGVAVEGALRRATSGDRERAVEWVRAFTAEAGIPLGDPEGFIAAALAEGRLWLWQTSEAVCMTVNSNPVEGVTRLSAVYTPPRHRGRGYAGACVRELSRRLMQEGLRCILFTDLENPTANALYRRIGYVAVAECLQYSFAPPRQR